MQYRVTTASVHLLFYKLRRTVLQQTVLSSGHYRNRLLHMQSASQSLSSTSGRMSFTNNLSACNNFVHNISARPYCPQYRQQDSLAEGRSKSRSYRKSQSFLHKLCQKNAVFHLPAILTYIFTFPLPTICNLRLYTA
jgi:hypothetical protein